MSCGLLLTWNAGACGSTIFMLWLHPCATVQSMPTVGIFYFLLDILSIHISDVFPLPGSPSSTRKYPNSSPLSLPTNPPKHPCPALPHTGASIPLSSRGPSSHWCPTSPSSATYASALFVHSLCEDLVPECYGGSGWFKIFLLSCCKPNSFLGPF